MDVRDMFRAYDVRGTFPDPLSPGVMRRIGQAYATFIAEQGYDACVIGHDVRESSPELLDAFREGVMATGVDVKDAGFTPYGPVLHAATEHRIPSAFVTASHLPKEWNGVKFSHANGLGFSQEENEAVHDLFLDEAFAAGTGTQEMIHVIEPYLTRLLDAVELDEVSVLMDCGNGSSCIVAPDLFERAGADVTVINGEPDGTFPNRASDVTDETVTALKQRMKEGSFDVGIAYDGDADRVAAVDDTGRLLSAEQLAAVLLRDAVEHHDGPVIANVECSRLLEEVAAEFGREVQRVRVGHTYLFQAMQRTDAVLGVEKSGHMAVSHVLPLNDGIPPSLYLAAVVSRLAEPLSAVVDRLPTYHRDRVAFEVPDDVKFRVIERLQAELSTTYEETNTLDGIRVDLESGWALIRASNTSPKIRLTVEAADEESFKMIRDAFTDVLADAISTVG